MWYHAIPCTAICFGLFMAMDAVKAARSRLHYRGIFDNRVEMEEHGDDTMSIVHKRFTERDLRLSLYPESTEWVHPLWSPKHIAEQMKNCSQ